MLINLLLCSEIFVGQFRLLVNCGIILLVGYLILHGCLFGKVIYFVSQIFGNRSHINVINYFKLLYHILLVEIMEKFMRNLMVIMISIDGHKKCFFFCFGQTLKNHAIAILKEKPTKQSCLHWRHKTYAKYVCKSHTKIEQITYTL